MDHGGDPVDIQGEGVAEENEKENRDRKGKGQARRIPKDLNKFLPGDGF